MSGASQLVKSVSQLSPKSFKNEQERITAVNRLKTVIADLQAPFEHVWDLTWIQPAYSAALRTTIDTDMYTKWVADGGRPKTAAELSQLCGVDEEILTRLLRHIVAMNGLKQPRTGVYALTSFTWSLAGSGSSDAIRTMAEATHPALANLPVFLASVGYKGPINPAAGNWQHFHGNSASYVEWIGGNPERTKSWHSVMRQHALTTPEWTNIYPSEKLIQNLKPGRAVIVDIGGSTGTDLQAFQSKHPDLPEGSLINQDLEMCIKQFEYPAGITPMVQDMFDPQQVKGAKCYFMHLVLHGFDDEQSLKALKNIVAVLEPGYSKVLIDDKVVDDEKLDAAVTAMDLMMLSGLSSKERTKEQWTQLLDKAGLRIVKIYSDPTCHESIIEAELA